MKTAIFCLIFYLLSIEAVDRTNFKTCGQSSFCKRSRSVEPNKSTFEYLTDNIETLPSEIKSLLVDRSNNVEYTISLYAVQGGIFRLKINELKPLKERFEVPFVLVQDPVLTELEVVERSSDRVVVKSHSHKAVITTKPFRLDVYNGEDLVITVNSRGLMKFEHIREKPEKSQDGDENEESTVDPEFSVESGAWDENFKSHHDNKPYGPEAVALDFSFPEAYHAYGIPEHADSFALKSTKNTDPYRLYNLDVFEYELDNGMALYAGVPVLYAHGPKRTAGLFWLNAAETWVDILSHSDLTVISSIVNLVSGSNTEHQIDAHFMSESGIIDVFLMLGPKPDDVAKQYASLTGTQRLPQMFALGYHQSRWNYMDQDEVGRVHATFDQHDIPVDTIWLDIEYTNGKKYFTWDPSRFPNPVEMTKNLTAKGRKLVVIIDPHIKRESGYSVHTEAEANDFYVKTAEGKVYEGWCWPGSVSYLDFLVPEVRDYWASHYLLDHFPGSTLDTYLWNDMNEPSVFNGPEVTMPKDLIHAGKWEHRDMHNIYGLLNTISSYDGLYRRAEGKLRPFILTRSAFAGSQRYVAIWTGDNSAEWPHLKITVPMCLSLSVGGMPFCGADVGGFFKYPDAELITRWYQAAAYQPFMRAHSHIDTRRREPWTYDDTTIQRIRTVLRERYSLLPFWYTLFYLQEKNAEFVMRPLWASYPTEKEVFAIDDQYLLGTSLLVHPVTEQGARQVTVYFPGEKEYWYDVTTHERITTHGNVIIPVDMDKVPVYQRGGSIIPKKERIRRSSVLMRDDPYTLVVALDSHGSATGYLYIDDEQSFDYRDGKFLFLKFTFKNGKLTSRHADKKASFDTKSWLEKVVILGLENVPTGAELTVAGQTKQKLQVKYSQDNGVVIIRKPDVNMAKEFEIKLE